MILMKTKESFMITNARNVYECTILRVRYWHFYLVDICAQPQCKSWRNFGWMEKACCARLPIVRVGFYMVGASEF